MQGYDPKPIGSRLLPYGTPLHVRDLVLSLLRWQFEHFPEEYPYRFVPDDYHATHIIFDTIYNKDSEVYGKKPIVIIARDVQSTSPAVVGDLGTKYLPTGNARGSTLVGSDISAKVISKIAMESEIIGQTIFNIFLSYRTILPSVLGIHNISDVSLTPISRFEQDTDMYVCQVDMRFSMQYKWISEAENPVIEGIYNYITLLTKQ